MVARRADECERPALSSLDRGSGAEERELVARRRADRVGVEVRHPATRGHAADELDVLVLVAGRNLLDAGRPRSRELGEPLEQRR